MGIKWEYLLTLIFAIFSVLLIVLMGAQVKYGKKYKQKLLHEIQNVQSAGFTLQELPDSPLTEQSLDEYNELAERPLFFAGRKPIVIDESDASEAAVEDVKELENIQLSLIGIIDTTGSLYALFYDPKPQSDGASQYKRFKLGEGIDGWTIEAIKSDQVSIKSAAGSKDIPLRKPRIHKVAPKRKKTRRTNPFTKKIKK